MKKRDRLEVIHDILVTVRDSRNSIRYTALLRSSRLSTTTFTQYYAELVGKGFMKDIVDKQGGRYVSLTDKGFRYLERYTLIRGLIREFEL